MARASRELPSGNREPGAGIAPGTGQHGAALRLRPGRAAEAARFPVVSPLTFKQNCSGGPGPGGRLPASSRFLPWRGAREGRPWGCSPGPWPEHLAAGTPVVSASAMPGQGVKVALLLAERMAWVTLSWMTLGSSPLTGSCSWIWQPGTKATKNP